MAGPRLSSATTDGVPTHGRILIVEARYYDGITNELLAGAKQVFESEGTDFDVVTVPGALEIPVAASILVEAASRTDRPYDGVVALGCVIRGETSHYDIVAGESARALMDLGVARQLPVGNGILTVETEVQAWARARVSDGNKGAGAAEAVLALLRLKRRAVAAAGA
jgi:6,7-dimethyl-8-ribityllumazine synthase